MNKEVKRSEYLDVVKGVAIFLMLWGHTIQYCATGVIDFFENHMFKLIYSFHMPLFMLVSGYLFYFSYERKTLKELYIGRMKSLVHPLIMCSIFNFCITIVVKEVLIRKNLLILIDGKWLESFSELWFLWSVIAAVTAVCTVYKITSKGTLRIILLIAAGGMVLLFPNAELNLFMYPYFICGLIFAEYREKIPKTVLNLKYLSLVIFPVMMLSYEKKHYIYITGIYGDIYAVSEYLAIDTFRWIIGLAGAVFALTIISLLMNVVCEKCLDAVKLIGKRSLEVYCLSTPLLSYYLPLVSKFCFKHLLGRNYVAEFELIYNLIFTPLIATIYALLLYWICIFFDRVNFGRILFGK